MSENTVGVGLTFNNAVKVGVTFNEPIGFIEGDSNLYQLFLAVNKLADEVQKLKELNK